MKIQIEEKKPIDVPSEWCSFDGAKFLIAGSSKPAFKRKMDILGAKIGQEVNGNRKITDESAESIPFEYNKACADLILDWDGIVDVDNNPIKYSTEMAEQLCTLAVDPETKEKLTGGLILFVSEQSERIQEEADKTKDELLGKLPRSTNGLNSTAKKKQRNTTSNNKL